MSPNPASAEPAAEPLRIGRITRPHGLRGALRVALDHPGSTTLQTVERVTIDSSGERREYTVVRASALGAGAVRLELEGMATVAAAESLRGAIVMVAVDALPPAAEGEFYDFLAIGCEVITGQGQRVGVVERIFNNGGNDVMVLREGGREILIPVIADVIKRLDFIGRRITIVTVPGLLD